MEEQSDTSDRRGVLIAVILIAVGAVFLIGEIFNIRYGSWFWPFLFIIPGAVMLFVAFNQRPAVAGLAIGGAIVTTLGLIFWYQVVSGNWESWAYIWALFPLVAGVAQMVVGARNDDESLMTQGRQAARIGGIMLVIGIVFFELIIFDRGGFGGYFLPIALIAVGAFMLWRHYNGGGDMPWAGMFNGPEPTPTNNATTGSEPPPAAPTPSASTPPQSATPPQAAIATPPPASEPFPEDELPHSATSGDAPFPVDEQSPPAPETPPETTDGTPQASGTPSTPTAGASGTGSSEGEGATEATPKRTTRRRTTTRKSPSTRKSTTTRKRPPREG